MAKHKRKHVFTVTLPHIDGEMLVRRLVNLGDLMTTAEPELGALVEELGVGEPIGRGMAAVILPVAAADPAAVATAAEESMAAFVRQQLGREASGDDVRVVFGDGFAVQSTRGIRPDNSRPEEVMRTVYAMWFMEPIHMATLILAINRQWQRTRETASA